MDESVFNVGVLLYYRVIFVDVIGILFLFPLVTTKLLIGDYFLLKAIHFELFGTSFLKFLC